MERDSYEVWIRLCRRGKHAQKQGMPIEGIIKTDWSNK